MTTQVIEYEYEDLSAHQQRLILELKGMGKDGLAPKLLKGAWDLRKRLEHKGIEWEEACSLARLVPFVERNKRGDLPARYVAIDKYEQEKKVRGHTCDGCEWASKTREGGYYCPWAGGCYKRDSGTLGATL